MIKKSLRVFSVLGVAWGMLASAQPVAAISLDFIPQNQTMTLGVQASVDVVVDPMGAFVGAYDIIVSWDDVILDLASVTVDPANDLGTTIPIVDTLGTMDSVNVASLSLEVDLTPFQDGVDPVALFSLTFDTIAVGASALSFTPGIQGFSAGFLSDETGELLPTPANDGTITVIDAVAVPVPATLLLLATGVAGLAAARRGPRARRDRSIVRRMLR